jgi:hypothetical protein
MIALETLDRLCTVLRVKPGHLFEHEAEPDKLPSGPVGGAVPGKGHRRGSSKKAVSQLGTEMEPR